MPAFYNLGKVKKFKLRKTDKAIENSYLIVKKRLGSHVNKPIAQLIIIYIRRESRLLKLVLIHTVPFSLPLSSFVLSTIRNLL